MDAVLAKMQQLISTEIMVNGFILVGGDEKIFRWRPWLRKQIMLLCLQTASLEAKTKEDLLFLNN